MRKRDSGPRDRFSRLWPDHPRNAKGGLEELSAGCSGGRAPHACAGREIGGDRGGQHGGDAAADAVVTAKPGEIDKLVVLAAQGGEHPERLNVKKLFILSRDDTSGAGPRLPGIRAAYDAAPRPKQLVLLEGSAHAQFLFETDQGPRLMREILRVLKER